jgi:hypothetical protein
MPRPGRETRHRRSRWQRRRSPDRCDGGWVPGNGGGPGAAGAWHSRAGASIDAVFPRSVDRWIEGALRNAAPLPNPAPAGHHGIAGPDGNGVDHPIDAAGGGLRGMGVALAPPGRGIPVPVHRFTQVSPVRVNLWIEGILRNAAPLPNPATAGHHGIADPNGNGVDHPIDAAGGGFREMGWPGRRRGVAFPYRCID